MSQSKISDFVKTSKSNEDNSLKISPQQNNLNRIDHSSIKRAEFEIYFCVLINHDFLFYSGPMYNATSHMLPYINSSALNYALNQEPRKIHRMINQSQNDHYSEDFSILTKICTPAIPLKTISWQMLNEIKNKIQFYPMLNENTELRTWNSLDVRTWAMPGENHPNSKKNTPKKGQYEYKTPLNGYAFFMLGGKGTEIIRIGKFYGAARIYYQKVQDIQFHPRNNSLIKLSHAINAIDVKAENFHSGQLIMIPPFSIINKPILKNIEYFSGKINGESVKIQAPSKIRYNEIYQKISSIFSIKDVTHK